LISRLKFHLSDPAADAFGENLEPDRLERVMVIDARLDRQFE
jgi:hypothetical protein